jgi:hypothetical protein
VPSVRDWAEEFRYEVDSAQISGSRSARRFCAKESSTTDQARDWHCVRQHYLETTDRDVMVLPCVAARPKDEKLDAEEQDILDKLEIDRMNVMSFKGLERQDPKRSSLDTGKGKEMMDALRMGFGQNVGKLCQKHPNLVLAPLFPDLTSGNTTLYGCKNIIAAPEK